MQAEFVAMVSHEFRTPLQIIDGARENILRKAKKDFGGQLFGDATGPISIVHYQKE